MIIQKNWQELIKPNQPMVQLGDDAERAASITIEPLERGFGHTPYSDHFAHIGGFQVVLPQGDVLRTGFGQFENAAATSVYRWGVGPHFDGLFTQSNLGVIVEATIWLMPAPPYMQFFACRVK